MRLIGFLVCAILLSAQTLVAQTQPDTIRVNLSRQVGVTPFARFSSSMLAPTSSFWVPLSRTYAGQERLSGKTQTFSHSADILQKVYQGYYSGKLSNSRYDQLKKAWKWNPNEEAYSKAPIRADFGILVGKDSKGKHSIVVDQNNNGDFSDDAILHFDQVLKFGPRSKVVALAEVEVDVFDQEIKPIKIWYMFQHVRNWVFPDEYWVTSYQYHKGQFDLDGQTYYVFAISDKGLFRQSWSFVLSDHPFEKELNLEEPINDVDSNSHVKIGNAFYKAQMSITGDEMLLVMDKDAFLRGGREPGMLALDFQATTIEGKSFLLSELKGKYVLLDFWGTWCPPCIDEIPWLKKARAAYADKGLEIVSVALNDEQTLKSYVKKKKMNWTHIAQESADDPILSLYSINAYPTTYLINPDGVIIAKDLSGQYMLDWLEREMGKK